MEMIIDVVQVWTDNAYTGVVGVFHLQGAFWDRETRRFAMGRAPIEPLWARVRDTDVPTLPAVAGRLEAGGGTSTQSTAIYRHLTDEVVVVDETDHSACVRVNPADADMLTLAPIVRNAAGVEHAALGLTNMLNGGGAMENVSYAGDVLSVELRGEGEFLLYCTHKPVHVEVDGVVLSEGDEHGWKFSRQALRVDVAASALNSGVDHVVRVRF
jgi:raffinose synthase